MNHYFNAEGAAVSAAIDHMLRNMYQYHLNAGCLFNADSTILLPFRVVTLYLYAHVPLLCIVFIKQSNQKYLYAYPV